MKNDIAIRQQLSDMNISPLVFAPAGSGKTTELVKRKLSALLDAEEPEAVLSVTFTNKATSELRHRVFTVLRDADAGVPIKNEHERSVRELAEKVLARDKQKNWQLLKNPNRLEIKTIDGLCSSIVRQFPMSSGIGANTGICMEPSKMYRSAAMSFLNDYKKDELWSDSARQVLTHVSNDFEKAATLLAELLAKRDQWLPILYELRNKKDLRRYLEANAAKMLHYMMTPFINALKSRESDVVEVVKHVAKLVDADKQPLIAALAGLQGVPDKVETQADAEIMKGLGVLFCSFTGRPSIRKTLNKSQGMVAPNSFKKPEEKEYAQLMKDTGFELLDTFQALDIKPQHLKILDKCAPPVFGTKEWDLLSSMLDALPIASSKLLLLFKQANEVDFIEMAAAAQITLGEDEAPSNAALRLDRKYRHILVDEFQDTVMLQLTLLRKLTTGWEPGDGRTLFLVGDPMQSIYQFRGANISLFMLVAEFGINHIKPTVFELTSNFRSQAGIVDWVNSAFPAAFSKEQNMDTGATCYTMSVAQKSRIDIEPAKHVVVSREAGKEGEATEIKKYIDEVIINDPNASIALLARTRSDLSEIIELMKQQNLGHKAIKIHKLGNSGEIMDLTLLTRALWHIADKAAWVGLLRSPLVGQSLEEMLIVCGADDGNAKRRDVLLSRMESPEVLDKLSTDTQRRLRVVARVMNQSINQLERKAFHTIVRGAYYQLGGLSTLKEKTQLGNIEAFLSMLSNWTYRTFDVEKFAESLSHLYSSAEQTTNNIQVMTIHQAKGLEFDYVIIPSCNKGMRGNDYQLMEMDVLYDSSGKIEPSMAPSPETGTLSATMYHNIRSFQSIKQSHEAVRAAYVAVTRAKKQLFLSGIGKDKHDFTQFPETSIFGIVKEGLPSQINFSCEVGNTQTESVKSPKHTKLMQIPLMPLPQGARLAQYRGLINVDNDVLPTINWHYDMLRVVGIVVHKMLEHVSAVGLKKFSEKPLEFYKDKVLLLLKNNGVQRMLTSTAVNKVMHNLQAVLKNDMAPWLFSQREIYQAEHSVHLNSSKGLKKLIIDLTFKEDGKRYVFDYKTAEPEEGESESVFIGRMLAQYEQKISQYVEVFQVQNEKVTAGLVLTSIGKIVMYQPTSQMYAA